MLYAIERGSGIASLPHYQLFSIAPAGNHATSQAEVRQYYQSIMWKRIIGGEARRGKLLEAKKYRGEVSF